MNRPHNNEVLEIPYTLHKSGLKGVYSVMIPPQFIVSMLYQLLTDNVSHMVTSYNCVFCIQTFQLGEDSKIETIINFIASSIKRLLVLLFHFY